MIHQFVRQKQEHESGCGHHMSHPAAFDFKIKELLKSCQLIDSKKLRKETRVRDKLNNVGTNQNVRLRAL